MYHRFFIFICCSFFCAVAMGSPIDSLHKEATYLYLDGYYADAYFIFKKNLELQEKQKHTDEEFLARTHRNTGMCLVELNQIDKAEKHLNQAVEGYKKIITQDEAAPDYKKIVNRLGVCYQHRARAMLLKGDFTKGINDANQALVQFKIADKPDNIIRINNILANIFLDSQQYEKAKEHCETTILKYQSANIDKNALADIYHTLAVTNIGQTQYKQAIKNYQEALKLSENPIDLASTYNGIGFAYLKMEDVENSEKYLTKGLKSRQKTNNDSPYHFSYASTYENFGDLKAVQKQWNDALNYYQKSLINLTDNFRNQDINTNPKVTGNHYIYNKPDLLRVLDFKAQVALKSGNTDLAHRTYADLDNWINEFYKDLTTNESKLTWIARAHAMYGHAVEVALKKGDKEKAFEYAEKAHAVLLWQSLSQQAAQSLLSENDKEKMDDLNAKIRQADQQYRYQEISINELRELEREREVIEKQFEQKYPEYKKRKYQTESISVADIQKKIVDDKTAFIEYYWTDDVLYIFIITKNTLQITQQPTDELAKNITNFKKIISDKNSTAQSYHSLAHQLYQQLLPSDLRSNEAITRLVIVPDKEIGTLPFAALATESASGNFNKNYPFLLKKYTTNYLYSAGSFLQLQQKTANQSYCFAGIAPIEYQMEKWKEKPLPFSEAELEGIKPLHWSWQREILVKKAATKAAFERIIKEGYRTIQVSTHAAYGESGGQIIFHDSILNQDEIDQLEINTHRLILSACETGVGEQNKGEGILSLGWNFAYKGVPSITMTHWSVNDGRTKDIMINYHENLNNDTPTDQALQDAQINYLKHRVGSDKFFHPHYWAAFIHTGNTE